MDKHTDGFGLSRDLSTWANKNVEYGQLCPLSQIYEGVKGWQETDRMSLYLLRQMETISLNLTDICFQNVLCFSFPASHSLNLRTELCFCDIYDFSINILVFSEEVWYLHLPS